MDNDERLVSDTDCCNGFVQSLDRLHKMRDISEQLGLHEYVEAFNVVFRWIDEMVLLLHRSGGDRG